MEQSDKHKPRVDQAMADHDASFLHGAPVDSRTDERFRDEGTGPRPGSPSADAQPENRQPGTSEGLSALEVAERSELASYIQPSVFPADRATLLGNVREANAPNAVVNLIGKLPEGMQFEHMQDVWEAVSS